MSAALRWLCLAVLACLAAFGPASAHEVRPGYLEIVQTGPVTHAVTWKQPVTGNQRLRIDPVFPEGCTRSDALAERAGGALIERFVLTCSLGSGAISIAGLDRTLTDVFLRVERSDGETLTAVLRPGSSSFSLDAPQGAGVWAYLRIGVDHILLGFDHLLFVTGIVLLVGRHQLLGTVTAFTLAHSLTLGLSALGGISLPGPPVEIVIALSISLLGVEAIHRMRGDPSLGARKPWLIAFLFGLIHGFGFAGALSEIGLPKGTEVLALALFNVGVEVGQVLVLAVLLLIGWLVTALREPLLRPVRLAGAYFVGTAGMYWTFERIAGLAFV